MAKIDLQVSKPELSADGYDVAVISARLIDQENNLITDQDQTIHFKIQGQLKNLGVDNGWEYSVQPHKANSIRTHQGKAAMIVQATRHPETATIQATSKDLASDPIQVNVVRQ